jgi:hypothetical protein
MNKPIITLSLLALAVIISFSCKGTQEKKEPEIKEINRETQETFRQEYMKEGLISNSVYRIVIVTPEDDCSEAPEEMKYKAIQRAQVSIRNYIVSLNGTCPQNASIKITNLINDSGKLILRRKGCPGSAVYNFDVARQGLKAYIKSIASGN